jgi:alkaline phosphatase
MYIDGFVFVVPKKKFAAYKKMAKDGARLWMKHGAVEYKECVQDDMKTPMGLSFPTLTKAKKDELVCFSFIVFKNRKHRDAVNKKVMGDPSMQGEAAEKQMQNMPFDMKRMAYGGFKGIVEA